MLSLGWVLETGLIGVYGLVRFWRRREFRIAALLRDAGLIYLPLGGFWFAAYRFGMEVLHFSSTIISLTAIHFHYAFLAVPVLTALAARYLDHTAAFRLTACGIIAGPVLVAAGITFSRTVEMWAVMLYAISLFLYIFYTFVLVRSGTFRGLASMFLVISSFSLFVTMGFAVAYAIGRGFGESIVSIPTMVLIHGMGNAFGFVSFALLAWSVRLGEPSFPVSRIRGEGFIGRNFLERNGWLDRRADAPQGLVDDFSVYRSESFQPARVSAEIRQFYEQTAAYDLLADTKWHRGFRMLSRLYKRLSERMEQLNLASDGSKPQRMAGAILPVDSSRDGRERVRAWVRWDEADGKGIFTALYAVHQEAGQPYMNIALPLPGGNMTGILRPEHDGADGLILRSTGIYFVFNHRLLRLPLEETFHVRAAAGGMLLANHRMRLCGLPFLQIEYQICKKRDSL